MLFRMSWFQASPFAFLFMRTGLIEISYGLLPSGVMFHADISLICPHDCELLGSLAMLCGGSLW